MNAIFVIDGIVSNAAVFDDVAMLPDGWVPSVGDEWVGWIANGDGTFSPPQEPQKTTVQIESEERAWRNSQLTIADVEIFKIEDVAGDASAWRAYRVALRDWPADANFPDVNYRPVAPV